MKTTIDNDLMVYQIITSDRKQFFCNIEDLNRIVLENNLVSGRFVIYHFWNNQAIKVSKKDLKDFFKGSNLDQEFVY